MNIGYIRCVFPKFSETFILEEVRHIARRGHCVVVYCQKCDVENIQPRAIEARVFDWVHIDCRNRSGWMHVRRLGGFWVGWLGSRRQRAVFGRDLFPHRDLWRECRRAEAGGGFWQRWRMLAGALWHTAEIGNWSLALAQQVKWRERVTPDMLHCPFTFEWDCMKLRRILRRAPALPYTLTLRARDMYCEWRSSTYGRVKEDLLQCASSIFTISEFNRGNAGQLLNRREIAIIHSAIDSGYFRPRPAGAKAGPPVILSVARLVPKKGMAHLIQACHVLAGRGLHFRCRIIGEGPMHAELDDLVRQLGLTESVELAGAQGQDRVVDALSQATMFVLPCVVCEDGDRDILPNSVKEAMSMELPVVTSRVSGIEELVIDGHNGHLVAPADSRGLANAIEVLLRAPAECRRLGENARKTILEQFDVQGEADRLLMHWNALLDSRNVSEPAEIVGVSVSAGSAPHPRSI